ncbi:hypothetical protein MHC_05025 [Mycoplasma haemocanis str. Illinois]|uniref:Uncharacterized protein n=1 Tax=Mycoplasma haemocanis (strain Illinois) TaxID=1111676 RepID=H6N889_MYCHN|nr:hypothetical protein MHC_05025 [Mycoplasma haemocanis str. Illinois]
MDHITSKKRELVSVDEEWKKKDTPYKTASKEDLISSVEPRDRTKTKLWQILKNWCISTGSKVFTNIHDDTYQKFSIWCLKTKTIKQDLEDEGFKQTENWKDKAVAFKDKGKNSDSSFITPSDKSEVKENDIKTWCTNNEAQSFRHEADQTYLRVKKWCYEQKKTIT